jgi:Rnl2 family RNA ligase
MEEPNFDGYHKIVESSQKWVTDESTNSLIKKTKWVVMEKVHGANFCIIIDGNKTIKCAKRREILPENEDFFGHKRILPELRLKIEKLQELILQNFSDTKHVFVFGEIFGGA